jgi:solute:Na+ symporter, SSS family
LLFTAWATLTLNGGKLLNLHRYNYPWHEYTIGAIGNFLLLIVGLIVAFALPAALTSSSSLTLWDWLAERRQTRLQAIPQEHP